ncbi:MAG: hypothetical protein IJU16_04055 [Clostridia bacterium]|nr:hypothetical protein [Clostridia bacterium]
MYKKSIALFAAIALLVAMLIPAGLTVSADTRTATVTLTPSGDTALGGTVQVAAVISENSYLVNADMVVTYDPTKLELDNTAFEDPDDEDATACYTFDMSRYPRNSMVMGKAAEPGVFKFVYATGSKVGLTAGIELFCIAFKVIADEPGDTSVTFSADPICGNDGEQGVSTGGYPLDFTIEYTASPAVIHIAETAVEIPAAPEVTLDYDTMQTAQSFTNDYEYCVNDGAWQTCTNAPITITPAAELGTLSVRKAADGDIPAGKITTVTIWAKKTIDEAITVTFNGASYTIDGLLPTYTYQLLLTNSADADNWDDAIAVRAEGEGENVMIEDATLYAYAVIRRAENAALYELSSNPAQLSVTRTDTGLYPENGSYYYVVDGVRMTGWLTLNGGVYYFGADGYAVNGVQTIDGGEYGFENYQLVQGAWIDGSYYWAGVQQEPGWATIDGNVYYFDADARVVTGYVLMEQNGHLNLYHFSDTGVLLEQVIQKDGLYAAADGDVYYFENGALVASRLVEQDGEFYYIGADYKALRGTSCYLDDEMAAGLIPAGQYEFDENGCITTEFINGPQANGFFYINSIKQKAYKLIAYEGYYYFVAENHKYVVSQTRYLSAANLAGTELPAGYYEFDEAGHLLYRNGPMADGYFYLNNEKQKAYKLCEYNGNYYFVAEYNKYVVSQTRYLNATHLEGTDFLPGYFEFDADGRMVTMNGPMADGYFYINNVKQKAYKLCAYNGNYYFVAENNKYAVSQTRYLSAANLEGTPFAPGYYDFDADGRLVDRNGPQADGYFYINNEKQKAYKLCWYNGYYYLVAEYNKYAVNQTRYLKAELVEGTGLAVGYYEFDAEGRLSTLNGPQADGYFYINNEKQKAYKLCFYNGYYYLVAEYNKYAVSQTRYLNASLVEGTDLTVGYYEFDSEGRLVTL